MQTYYNALRKILNNIGIATLLNSKNLYKQAEKIIPGGVNSPVRAFRGVDGQPIFIQKGEGAYITDEDGQSYIDFVGSWGPLIVGHAHPYIVEKVSRALHNGVSFGASTVIELQLAEKITALMPNIEMIRFVNSGTEAAMSAIRLARGFTGKNKIIKFAGCYHGHADTLLVSVGSGGLTFGVPSSAGVPQVIAQETLIAEFNNAQQVRALCELYRDDIAAIIVEPIAGNMNLVLPTENFLADLRQISDDFDSVLIFDEVITGFRVGIQGAQGYYNIQPDLTILGKVIGGGFPVAAFGGRQEIMQQLAPLGPVYQAGTLSGNPIAMTAGLAMLDLITQPNFYVDLTSCTANLVNGLNGLACQYNIPFHAIGIGGMFGLFFTDQTKISNEVDVKQCNINLFKQFFHAMLRQGIYLAPSAFEIGFVSQAHGMKEIQKTLTAAENFFANSANNNKIINA